MKMGNCEQRNAIINRLTVFGSLLWVGSREGGIWIEI